FRYTPAGDATVFGTVPGRSAGITFDADFNLFVSDRGPIGLGDNVLYQFTPGGERSVFATGLNDTQGLAFSPTPVPEPASLLLAVLGSLGAAGFAWRQLAPRTVRPVR